AQKTAAIRAGTLSADGVRIRDIDLKTAAGDVTAAAQEGGTLATPRGRSGSHPQTQRTVNTAPASAEKCLRHPSSDFCHMRSWLTGDAQAHAGRVRRTRLDTILQLGGSWARKPPGARR